MYSVSADYPVSTASEHSWASAAFPGGTIPADVVELVHVVGLPIGETFVQKQTFT